KREYHNVALRSPRGVPLELHFSVLEDLPRPDTVLKRVWDYAVPAEGGGYRLSPGFTFFYIYAHAYYHFINGGCGIRPLVDGYLFARAYPEAPGEAAFLFEEAGISVFADEMQKAALSFLEKAPGTKWTPAILQYLFSGGKFGFDKRRMALWKAEGMDWKTYRRNRVFLSYEKLCTLYPSLRGKKILTPLFQARRLLRLLAEGKAKQLRNEKKTFDGADNGEETAALFSALSIPRNRNERSENAE
ncbi:MAG: nucleotidyltransferase family protein, partial [Clostridia bacterium]|nr:nucleotidyltransferase family protein [Clostridia bacterium]